MTRALLVLANDDIRAKAIRWIRGLPKDAPLSKICAHCGSEFTRDNRCTWDYWVNRARFCSRKCAGMFGRTVRAVPPIREHFETKFTKSDGCWEWNGARDKDGYGIFPYKKKAWRANILALVLDGRPPAKGKYACHTCDNPACVNPGHLYPGTPVQNSADSIQRDRHAYGERRTQSKLTNAAVLEIRRSTETHEELAMRFGVSRATISLAAERKTWRHIP